VRTAFHPVTWLCRGLAALLILGLPSVDALEPAPVRQVLIATETSHFKDAVVTQVSEMLRQGGHAATTIELERLATEPIRNYQAIVLINTCRAWRPSSEVRDYLKKASDADKNKLVVLTTANSGECDLRVAGIDAISAASKQTKVDVVSQAVVAKLRTRLAAP
jgi:hypothetical protein